MYVCKSRGSCFTPHQFAAAVHSSCPPRLPLHGSVGAPIIFIMCVALACLKSVSGASCQRGDTRAMIVHDRSFTHRLFSLDEHSPRLQVRASAFWSPGLLDMEISKPWEILVLGRHLIEMWMPHVDRIGTFGWLGRNQRS